MSNADQLAELQQHGYCVLRRQYAPSAIEACRAAFWPTLTEYLEQHRDSSNRGPYRHFVPMPFDPPCFAPEFFFDPQVLSIARESMDDRIVADQWACDAPLIGSMHQGFHADYQRPLFPEAPDLALPCYMLVVSFGLIDITLAHGPIEIAAGTHRMRRTDALRAVEVGEIKPQPVILNVGDVLIRHPWALHRGTPNMTETPRALLTTRYVRSWYADASREINAIPQRVWQSFTNEQRSLMRFPVGSV